MTGRIAQLEQQIARLQIELQIERKKATKEAAISIDVLAINTRAHNALRRADINSIADLLYYVGADRASWPTLLCQVRGISLENARNVSGILGKYLDLNDIPAYDLPAKLHRPSRVLDPVRGVYVKKLD